jgi:hypothetical protein
MKPKIKEFELNRIEGERALDLSGKFADLNSSRRWPNGTSLEKLS